MLEKLDVLENIGVGSDLPCTFSCLQLHVHGHLPVHIENVEGRYDFV